MFFRLLQSNELDITDSELIRELKSKELIKFDGVKIFLTRHETYTYENKIFISCSKLIKPEIFLNALLHELCHIINPSFEEKLVARCSERLMSKIISTEEGNTNFNKNLNLPLWLKYLRLKEQAKFLHQCF